MTAPSKALVLSGGGDAGAAWLAGIISALQEQGTDLGDADLIADEQSQAAIGPDALSRKAAQAALEAGIAQARREIGALRAIWPPRASQPG